MVETSREHVLFEELREARRKLGAAKVDEQDAKTALSARKAARLKAEALIEEILDEIDTGKTGRPLIDAANARGELEEALARAVETRERGHEATRDAIRANRGAGKPKDEDEDEDEQKAAAEPVNVFKAGVASRLRGHPGGPPGKRKPAVELPVRPEDLPGGGPASVREPIIGGNGAAPPAPAAGAKPAIGDLQQWDVYRRVGQEGRGDLLGVVTATSTFRAQPFLAAAGFASAHEVILAERRPAPDGAEIGYVPAEPTGEAASADGVTTERTSIGPPRGGRWDARRIVEAIESLQGVGALERAAAHQNLPLVVCEGCQSLHHVRHHHCPACKGEKARVIRAVLYDLGVWKSPRAEARSMRWPVHHAMTVGLAGGKSTTRGEVIGHVEAPDAARAFDRASEQFDPTGNGILIGAPQPMPPPPAAGLPDPHADELEADVKAATDVIKLWAVHRYDERAPKHRGERLGAVPARDRLEAAQLAADHQTWTAGGQVVLIGDEVVAPPLIPGAARGTVLGDPTQWREALDGKPIPEGVYEWSASRKLDGIDAAEVLGSFLATDEADALRVAQARWKGEGIAVRRLRTLCEPTRTPKPKPAGKPSHTPGPYNQDEALIRATALPEVRDELARLVAEGGTDDEIFRALVPWPTHRAKDLPDGNPWAVCGGSMPRFYYDTDALDKWGRTSARGATLEGDDLVKAVRRVLHVRKPKPSAADGKPVRSRKPRQPKPAEATP